MRWIKNNKFRGRSRNQFDTGYPICHAFSGLWESSPRSHAMNFPADWANTDVLRTRPVVLWNLKCGGKAKPRVRPLCVLCASVVKTRIIRSAYSAQIQPSSAFKKSACSAINKFRRIKATEVSSTLKINNIRRTWSDFQVTFGELVVSSAEFWWVQTHFKWVQPTFNAVFHFTGESL